MPFFIIVLKFNELYMKIVRGAADDLHLLHKLIE